MRSNLKSYNGFTLLELLTCVALLGILALIASANLNELLVSIYSTSARNELEADVSRARAEALAEGARAIITISADSKSYTVGLDYMPFSDPPVSEVTLFERELPNTISVIANQTIIFDSRGYLITSDGDITSTDVTLNAAGTPFADGTIYPTGALEYVL